MQTEGLVALITFVLVSTASPGGATILAAISGVQFGYRRSLPVILGLAAGLASLAVTASLGLAGVLLAAPSLQTVLKVVGSAYLLWLAWGIASSDPETVPGKAKGPLTFLGGAWLLWLNPKGWAMALSAAASFATLADSPIVLAGILGAVFGVAATASLSLWCLFGMFLVSKLSARQHWRIVNGALALMLAVTILSLWT
jgi:threonine/homoserine/homoserine lactone efflux protein